MQFKTLSQQICFEKIAPWMQQLFESTIVTQADESLFVTSLGSAVASTRIIPWGEEESIVLTRSCVVTDVEITPDLSYYLLRENDNLYFGRFAIDNENNITFEHSLVGSTCNLEDLRTSVIAVIRFANEYDDKIVERWGGQRASDRWSRALPWGE